MSFRELAARIAANPLEVLGARTRTARQILAGADPWEVIGDPSGPVRRMLLRRYGSDVVQAFEQLHVSFTVSPQVAELYWRWLIGDEIVGAYGDLERLRDAGNLPNLGQLFQIDHLIEARIHRMIRDGLRGHGLRRMLQPDFTGAARQAGLVHSISGTEPYRISDGASLIVPSNEITAWRLHRALAAGIGPTELREIAPRLYPHQGVGSKTTRTAQLIPWELEGKYSYRELLDGSIWITVREFGLPTEAATVIRDDMAKSIAIGVAGDSDLAVLVLSWVRRETGRNLTAGSEALAGAIAQALPVRTLPDNCLGSWEFRTPVHQVPFADATRAIFGADP